MSTRTDPFVTYTALVRSRGNGAPKCRELTEEHRRDEGGAQQGRVDLRRYQQKRGNGEQHLLPHPRAHQHETGEGSTETGDAGRAADEGDEELALGEIGDDQQQQGREDESEGHKSGQAAGEEEGGKEG